MQITEQQIINPGTFVYDDERRERLERFHGAVRRATFLDDEERERWMVLSFVLNNDQLKEGERLVIDEDLRLLQMRKDLERIKPKTDQY